LAEAVVANVPVPLIVLDEHRRVTAVNTSFLKHFQLDERQMLGATLHDAADGLWNIDEVDELLRACQRDRGDQEHEVERLFGPLGRRTLVVNARSLEIPGGPSGWVLLAVEDVTEKRRAEEVLRGEREALLIRVKRHEDELARAQASLNTEVIAHNLTRGQLLHANRLSTVGKLTAGLTHEMGTPINVITARGQMILRGQSQGEQMIEDVRVMVEQAQRVTQIVRELLDYSRQRPSSRPVDDLSALCERTLELLRPMARRGKVDLLLEPSTNTLGCAADAGEVQQVLTNLVVNAVDALDRGGTVRVRVATRQATPPGSQGALCWVVMSVSDDGPGIPPHTLGRVFEPFFTTKAPGKGTGLGLSVSGAIVKKLGGWIDVENLDGGGTRFSVHLPQKGE